MRTLHSQTATVNLAAGAVVLTHTITTATAAADLMLEIGDGSGGSANLDASVAGTLTVAFALDGRPIRGEDREESFAIGRTFFDVPVDTIPAAVGKALTVTITSDNAADTAVAVTATLRDAAALQPTTRGRQLLVDAEGDTTAGTTAEIAAAVSSSGTGQYLLPIVIIDDAAVPVPRAVISVYNSDGIYLGIHTASGTEGTATLQLDPGSYQIGATAHPTHSPALVPLEIADTDPDRLDIVLVTVATTPPGTGGLCRVRIPVREPAVAAPAAQITAQLVDENVSVGNDLLSRAVTRAETDDTGYADLLLPQGVTYRIVGEHGGHQFLNLEYFVPATAEAYLAAALGE